MSTFEDTNVVAPRSEIFLHEENDNHSEQTDSDVPLPKHSQKRKHYIRPVSAKAGTIDDDVDIIQTTFMKPEQIVECVFNQVSGQVKAASVVPKVSENTDSDVPLAPDRSQRTKRKYHKRVFYKKAKTGSYVDKVHLQYAIKAKQTDGVSENIEPEGIETEGALSEDHETDVPLRPRQALTSKHFKKKIFVCINCNESFSMESQLLFHQRGHKYPCKVCDKEFVHSSSLQNHASSHSDAMPFKCSTCGKCFARSSQLLLHQRRHRGIKEFKCNVCKKKFVTSSQCTVHERTHTGDKPYKCDVCDKQFGDLSSLSRHLRMHFGVKPFTCDICSKMFTQSSHLRKHQFTH